ncbi:MAG: winged helix-turn-helix transcriptional regulator [Magnetococcales bacterium]|nr:winged helix-turn-helix transcriptional regulator [Magnetococcales bacterium]
MECEFNEANLDKMARCFKVMAHPLRLKILTAIHNQELNVTELVAQVGSSQSNISQHLSLLRDKDILLSKRKANKVYYSLGRCNVAALLTMTDGMFIDR